MNSIWIRKGVLVCIELHKRWDQIYADARERIRNLGDFSFFHSYMSQPKKQLKTFSAWAGRSSDISYYLNSHHIDFHCWALKGLAYPITVVGMGSTGVAHTEPFNCPENTEDTITLTVQWKNNSKNLGTAVYTASWIAPRSEVHSQQRFFYMGHKGEIRIDQAHRGYEVATDDNGFASVNPLFMKYTPDSKGYFAGQNGYGYQSIESWVDECTSFRNFQANQKPGEKREMISSTLATLKDTLMTTAILEAGRNSLNQGVIPIPIDHSVLKEFQNA